LTSEGPADRFAASTGWREVLEPAGWAVVSGDGDSDGSRWRHPGATNQFSATISNGCLFVYSPNTPFTVTEDGRPAGYTKFRAAAILRGYGDTSDGMSGFARELEPRISIGEMIGDSARIGPDLEPVDETNIEPEPAGRVGYPADIWPDGVRRFFTETGRSTSVAPEMVATLALPVMATAIGASRLIKAKDDWTEYARMWAVVIAPPSTGKTPVGKAVRAPIQAIQRDLDAVYVSQTDQWETEGEKGRRPDARHMVAQNVTVEALTEAMVGHSRGTILYRDELTGWLQSMTQYKGGKGDDRQIFLEMWSGEPVRVVRKGKPPLIVHDPFLSIAGTTQPGRISELLRTDDGFAQRFLLCVPPVLRGDERAPAVSADTAAEWDRLIRTLYRLEGDDDGPLQMPWAGGARNRMLDHLQELRDIEAGDLPPALAQAVGKLRAYIVRFALILATVTTASEGDPVEAVTDRIVDDARRLADYYRGQAEAVYGDSSTIEPAAAEYRRVGPATEEALIASLRRRSPQTLRQLTKQGPRLLREADRVKVSEMVGQMESMGLIVVERKATSRGESVLLHAA
jgi:hypothetical protein